jgi:hypothetical protein
VPLKANVDAALPRTPPASKKVLVVRQHRRGWLMKARRRDVWWHEAAEGVEPTAIPSR